MKKRILLFLLLFLVVAAGNPFTQAWIAGHYVVDDNLEPADAVVALRGEPSEHSNRIEEARRLVMKRYAPIMVVSVDAKPFWGHSQRQLLEEYLLKEEFPPEQLRFCENTADSTAQEALALLACFQQMGVKEVIIVTSDYHTLRSRSIFRRTFSRSGIIPRIHPSYNDEYWDKHWWRKRRWAKTFFEETIKLIWSFVERRETIS
jgi:uncharacterized SAM-binding protein YcdF (DUF218 family)